jgi:integrase
VASLTTFKSRLRRIFTVLDPETPLATFDNLAMKEFVSQLMEERPKPKPATIAQLVLVVKLVIASAKDSRFNKLFPRQWNAEAIDCPMVIRDEQRRMTFTAQHIEQILGNTKDAQERLLYLVLAGSGLRISEAQSLQVGNAEGQSSWLEEQSMIQVRQALFRDKQREPGTRLLKSAAAKRSVFLCSVLNNLIADFCKAAERKPGEYLFQDEHGRAMRGSTIRYRLECRGGLGAACHSFRRFRTTHLRASRVLDEIIKSQLGHSKSQDMTDLYSHQGESFIRTEIERVSLGFEVPAVLAPQQEVQTIRRTEDFSQ